MGVLREMKMGAKHTKTSTALQSQKVETAQMSINGWMVKYVVHPHMEHHQTGK